MSACVFGSNDGSYGVLMAGRRNIGWVLNAMICATILSVISLGCDSDSDKSSVVEQLHFTVIDSLLGDAVFVPGTEKQFRPPVGFSMITESRQFDLQDQVASIPGFDGAYRLYSVLFNRDNGAGLAVAVVEGLDLSEQGSAFVKTYEKVLHETYGAKNLHTGEYWVQNVFVKNYMVTDDSSVHLQLLCMSKSGDGLELHYFVGKEYYQAMLRSFESSIGSLKYDVYAG